MSLPDFLRFKPAPVRARRDGWTPNVQRQFILLIARGATVGAAARQLGRSRQTAYALRDRPGAGEFAAAWDAAVSFGQRIARVGNPLPRLEFGLGTVLVPRFYRGRLVGFVQREDGQGAMRTLASLDRIAKAISLNEDMEGFDFEALVEAAMAAAAPEADKTDAMHV